MKQILSWWFPDGETHMKEHLVEDTQSNRGGEYQTLQRDYALCYMKKYYNRAKVALDIGGHVGLWGADMCQHFKQVIAFEPVKEFRKCYHKNMADRGIQNYTINEFALGNPNEKVGKIYMDVHEENSGSTKVVEAGTDDMAVDVKKLDTLGLKDVHFIKMDAEGYEIEILKGAKDTILSNRPVMMIEVKANQLQKFGYVQKDLRLKMKEYNYRMENVINNDYLFIPNDLFHRYSTDEKGIGLDKAVRRNEKWHNPKE